MNTVKGMYFNWQGTYASIFIFAFQPGVFGEQFYFLTTFIMLGTLISSTSYFLYVLLCKVYRLCKIDYIIVLMVVLLLSTQLIPDVMEGYYWFNGSSYYIIPYSCMLIFTGQLLEITLKKQMKSSNFLILFILSIFLSGGNYVTGLIYLEILVLFILYIHFIMKNKQLRNQLLILLVLCISLFLISMLAPGNQVRQNSVKDSTVLKAFLDSFFASFSEFSRYSSILLWVSMISLIPILKNNVTRVEKIPLLFKIMTLFGLFVSSYMPTLKAMSSIGAGRISNIRFFLLILVILEIEILIIQYLKTNQIINFEKINKKSYFNFFLLMSFIVVISLGGHLHRYRLGRIASFKASNAIYSKEAENFKQQMIERDNLLKSDKKEIELPIIVDKTGILYSKVDDILLDWAKVAVERKFGKKIKVKK